MRLFEHALLADENIHPEVVRGLIDRGVDVVSATQVGIGGVGDASIFRAAMAQQRIVVTHDRDFGTRAIRRGEPFVGIVYLKPGHISATPVLAMRGAIQASTVGLPPPFLVVAHRREHRLGIRVRHLSHPR